MSTGVSDRSSGTWHSKKNKKKNCEAERFLDLQFGNSAWIINATCQKQIEGFRNNILPAGTTDTVNRKKKTQHICDK